MNRGHRTEAKRGTRQGAFNASSRRPGHPWEPGILHSPLDLGLPAESTRPGGSHELQGSPARHPNSLPGQGYPPPGVGHLWRRTSRPFTGHDPFHGPNPPPRGCVRLVGQHVFSCYIFPFWKQKQLSRSLAQDGWTGMGYSTEFVCIFSETKRVKVGGGGRGGGVL